MIKCRFLILVAVILVCICMLSICTCAENYHGIPIEHSQSFPEDAIIDVHDFCSGHTKISYADARDDGWFITTSFITPKGYQTNERISFGIDIYDEKGNFYKELTFATSQAILTEIAEEGVNIYFYDHVITYDIESEMFICNNFPAGYLYECEWADNLTKRKFTVGEWNYSLSPIVPWGNTTTLIRNNGQERQVLVSFNSPFQDVFMIAAPILAVILCISIMAIKKRKQQVTLTEAKEDSPLALNGTYKVSV